MVHDGVRPPWDPPDASEGPRGHFAFLSLKPYNMGVYGLPWTQIGHWYRYLGTAVLFRYLTVLFRYLGSIHTNTYNVPSEPERAAKARRAVVASMF